MVGAKGPEICSLIPLLVLSFGLSYSDRDLRRVFDSVPIALISLLLSSVKSLPTLEGNDSTNSL